jgi:hypothetical protein
MDVIFDGLIHWKKAATKKNRRTGRIRENCGERWFRKSRTQGITRRCTN